MKTLKDSIAHTEKIIFRVWRYSKIEKVKSILKESWIVEWRPNHDCNLDDYYCRIFIKCCNIQSTFQIKTLCTYYNLKFDILEIYSLLFFVHLFVVICGSFFFCLTGKFRWLFEWLRLRTWGTRVDLRRSSSYRNKFKTWLLRISVSSNMEFLFVHKSWVFLFEIF